MVLVRVHERCRSSTCSNAGPGDHSWPVPRALAALQTEGAGVAVFLNCGESAAELLPRAGRAAAARKQPALPSTCEPYGVARRSCATLGSAGCGCSARRVACRAWHGYGLEVTGFVGADSGAAPTAAKGVRNASACNALSARAGSGEGAGLRIGVVRAASTTLRARTPSLRQRARRARRCRKRDPPGRSSRRARVGLALQAMAKSDASTRSSPAAASSVARHHFELVANESGAAIIASALDHGIAVANAVLTCDDEAQAAHGRRQGEGRGPGRGRDGSARGLAGQVSSTADVPARPAKRSSARRRSRELALQGLYAWLIGQSDAGVVDSHIREQDGFARCDAGHFDLLLHGVIANRSGSTRCSFPPRPPIAQLSPVEHATLLIGAFELSRLVEVPYKVAINEAVELAKSYGCTDGHKYVNGVLDKLAPELRKAEIEAARGGSR